MATQPAPAEEPAPDSAAASSDISEEEVSALLEKGPRGRRAAVRFLLAADQSHAIADAPDHRQEFCGAGQDRPLRLAEPGCQRRVHLRRFGQGRGPSGLSPEPGQRRRRAPEAAAGICIRVGGAQAPAGAAGRLFRGVGPGRDGGSGGHRARRPSVPGADASYPWPRAYRRVGSGDADRARAREAGSEPEASAARRTQRFADRHEIHRGIRGA